MFPQGQLQEIIAGVHPLGALKTVIFDGTDFKGSLGAKATMSTALLGSNNDIDYTAHSTGEAGNLISIEYNANRLQPGSAIAVDCTGNAITVYLAKSVAAEKAQGTMTSDGTVPNNNDTFVIDVSTYTFKSALTEVKASKVLTSDNTEVVDGDTVTVGTTVYRFKDVMAQANDVKRDGTTADTTMGNLIKAINGTGTAGVEYFAGTVAQTLVTAGALSLHAFTLTYNTVGVAGNSFAIAESSIHLSWAAGATALSGGVNSIANEILIDGGASAALTLDNVKSAVNGTAGAGSTYSTATVAHTTVDATTNTNTTQLFTAKTAGAAGNSIVFTENAAHIVVTGSGTLFRGTDAGQVNSIASDVTTAIAANAAAAALVDTANHAGNDGTGLVTNMAVTFLTSGSDGIVPLFTVSGPCLVSLRGYVETTLAGAGGTLVHGKTGTTNDLITILTGTTLTAGSGIDSTGSVARGTALAKTALKMYQDGETVFATIATHAITAGKIHYIADFVPLTLGAGVIAA